MRFLAGGGRPRRGMEAALGEIDIRARSTNEFQALYNAATSWCRSTGESDA
jgi:hypothetical protein